MPAKKKTSVKKLKPYPNMKATIQPDNAWEVTFTYESKTTVVKGTASSYDSALYHVKEEIEAETEREDRRY